MSQGSLHRLSLYQGPRDVAELRLRVKLSLSLLRLETNHLSHRVKIAVSIIAGGGSHSS